MPSILSSTGEVVIPKSIRDHLGIEPGAAVEFRTTDQGKVILERAEDEPRDFRTILAGLRGHAGPGLSTDEIMRMTRGDPDDDPH